MEPKLNIINLIKAKKKHIFWTSMLFLLLISPLLIAAYLVIKVHNVKGNILLPPIAATISIDPANQTLPPDTETHINIDAKTNSLGFIKVVLSFDQSKIQLSSEPIVNPIFSRIIHVSTMEEANSTGRLTLSAGIPPGSTAPTGIINDFLRFNLSAVSTNPNDIASLSFLTNEMQLVETNGVTSIPIIANSASYTLNQAITPSPDPTSTPTNTPTPLPTSTPTQTPTPTSSPSGDTESPVVNLTNPTNGAIVTVNSTVNITATASDNIAVSKVEFYVNGKRICIDTATPYQCPWLVPLNPRTYTIQAKAFDAQNNTSTNQITVSSSN